MKVIRYAKFRSCVSVVAILGMVAMGILLFGNPRSGHAAPQEPFEIYVPTLPSGFASYIMGVALAEQINKNSTWLKATAMEGRGPSENMKTLIRKAKKRDNYLFFNTTWDIWEAKQQIGPYKNFPFNYDEFRFVTLLGFGGNGLCTLDPKLSSLKDFEGKRVIFDSSAGKGRDIAFLGILKEAGVQLNKIKFQYSTGKGAADTLRDGLVDVIYTGHILKELPATWGNSPYQAELVSTKKTKYISIDEKYVNAFKEKTGHPLNMVMAAPKMLGPDQTEPCGILVKPLGFCAHISMPDRVVTEILRVVYENAEKFKDYTPMAKIITKNSMASLGLPEEAYHPAAVKFYKEKNIKIGKLGD